MVAETKNFTRRNWTYEEVSSIDDDLRRELHDGQIFEMPSPSLLHQIIVNRLTFLFTLWASRFGGMSFISPIDLYITTDRYFVPDFVFYTAQQIAGGEVLRDPKRLTVPPELVVEVISESTARNDRLRKVQAYAEFGIANYWIVDPIQRTLEAFELRDGHYQIIAGYEDGEIFTPKAFPDLQIDLQNLFAIG